MLTGSVIAVRLRLNPAQLTIVLIFLAGNQTPFQLASIPTTSSRRRFGTAAASFACSPGARRSEGTVATHKHPIQAAMLAVIVIEARLMQRGAIIDDPGPCSSGRQPGQVASPRPSASPRNGPTFERHQPLWRSPDAVFAPAHRARRDP